MVGEGCIFRDIGWPLPAEERGSGSGLQSKILGRIWNTFKRQVRIYMYGNKCEMCDAQALLSILSTK